MRSLRQLDRAAERRWPGVFGFVSPISSIYFAMVMLLVSMGLSILGSGGGGAVFAGAALGVLMSASRQMRRAATRT